MNTKQKYFFIQRAKLTLFYMIYNYKTWQLICQFDVTSYAASICTNIFSFLPCWYMSLFWQETTTKVIIFYKKLNLKAKRDIWKRLQTFVVGQKIRIGVPKTIFFLFDPLLWNPSSDHLMQLTIHQIIWWNWYLIFSFSNLTSDFDLCQVKLLISVYFEYITLSNT